MLCPFFFPAEFWLPQEFFYHEKGMQSFFYSLLCIFLRLEISLSNCSCFFLHSSSASSALRRSDFNDSIASFDFVISSANFTLFFRFHCNTGIQTTHEIVFPFNNNPMDSVTFLNKLFESAVTCPPVYVKNFKFGCLIKSYLPFFIKFPSFRDRPNMSCNKIIRIFIF